jgi:hypothetical protein
MKTASGTSSPNYVSQAAASANTNSGGAAATAPEPEDPSASFDNVLQQQTAGPSSAPTAQTTSTDSASATPSAPVDWQQIMLDLAAKATAAAAAQPATPATTEPAPPSSNPAATAQALLKTILGQEAASTPTTAAAAPSTSPTKNPLIPLYTGASTLMAHTAILAAQARQAAASVSASTSGAATTAANSSASSDDAPAMLAHALGLTLSLGKAAAKSSSPPTTEKKSDPPGSQGSFLQSDPSPDTASLLLAGMTGQAAGAPAQVNDNQNVASRSSSAVSALGGVAGSASAAAGMANGKKEEQMNATLDLASQFVSTGTNPMVMRTSADVNIQLGSNQNFKDALGQVMHVAELSGMSSTTPPLRVAIEIQTPPGAIVNVYVSKQDDGYRAQLSASDPQALSYVQNQISSLRQSTDTGVSVRWLPAQLETSSSVASSSSSGESGLSWDRGGQGQSGNQQPAEDRQQSTRQRRPLFEGVLAPVGSNSFMDAVSAFGSAA